ncbi:calcium-binding protein [Rhizobium sp.]
MAVKHISGIKTKAVEVNSAGNIWILDKNAHISSADYGFLIDSAANNSVIDIKGSINAAVGVNGLAEKLHVKVADAAEITGQIGIYMAGAKQMTADVDGEIIANQYGIVSAAAKTKVEIGVQGRVEATGYAVQGTGTVRFEANVDGVIKGGQIGLSSAAQTMKIDVGKNALIDGGAYGIAAVGTGNLDAKISGDVHSGQIGLQSSADKAQITLKKGGSIEGGAAGIYSTGNDRFTARIDGDVFGGQYAISTEAAKVKIEVGKGVVLESGTYGIYASNSTDATVINRGSIVGATGFAIGVGDGADIRNFGHLSGVGGMLGGGDKARMVNDGRIDATMYGMISENALGENAKLTNHGRIIVSDDGYAIATGSGNDKIMNDGRIIGVITGGNGNDTINLIGGTVKGQILGGAGNDTLVTDKASHKLVENAGEGDDTVKSSVTYKLSAEVERLTLTGSGDIDGTGTATANILRGNSGDNVLKGLAGADELYGGKGNDRLFGGDDVDMFHFSTGDGKDTIADFVTLVDDVDLSGWKAIQDFMQLFNHAKNDGDGNVVIKAGGDSLTILNMQKGDLDANDFLF